MKTIGLVVSLLLTACGVEEAPDPVTPYAEGMPCSTRGQVVCTGQGSNAIRCGLYEWEPIPAKCVNVCGAAGSRCSLGSAP